MLLLAFLLANLVGSTLLPLLLRQTHGRCKVRRIPVFRVAAYTATPAVLVGVVCFSPAALQVKCSWILCRARTLHAHVQVVLSLLIVLPVVTCGPYPSLGPSRYLYLPRPWTPGLTAALVGNPLGLSVLQYLDVLL